MISQLALTAIRSRPSLKEKVRKGMRVVGYDTTDWIRSVMYQSCFEFVRTLDPSRLEVLEIAAGPQWAREFRFRRYEQTQYPGFDICADVLPRRFDLIIADQVFEHLRWPYRAGRNVWSMLKPGGHFIIVTPFLIKVHQSPIDCSRWTETGLSYLLQECGFAEDDIRTHSWGNRRCLKANLTAWRKRGFFGSLANEADFPVMVWAFAKRAEEDASTTGRPT